MKHYDSAMKIAQRFFNQSLIINKNQKKMEDKKNG